MRGYVNKIEIFKSKNRNPPKHPKTTRVGWVNGKKGFANPARNRNLAGQKLNLISGLKPDIKTDHKI